MTMTPRSADQPSAAWSDLLGVVADLQSEIDARSADRPLDRAEGTRYLARLLAAALARTDERNDPEIRYDTPRIGGFNPDYRFGHARLEPGATYRLRGRMHDAARLAISTHASAMGTASPIGHLSGDAIRTDAGGGFEVVVGAESPGDGPDHLATGGTARALMVRQLLLHRGDRPAEIVMERVDGAPATSTPLTPTAARDALRFAALFVEGAARRFLRWSDLLALRANTIGAAPDEIADEVHADPDTAYALGYFDLAPGERLEIELDVPPCAYWGLHTTNHWLEPIEHDSLACHRNHATVEGTRPGAPVTMSIAPVAHAHPNALHTLGHANGAIFYRVVDADTDDVPLPRCTVRRLDELTGPGAAPTMTR